MAIKPITIDSSLSSKDQLAIKNAYIAGGGKASDISYSKPASTTTPKTTTTTPKTSSTSGSTASTGGIAPIVIDSNLSKKDQDAVKAAYLAGGGSASNISYSSPTPSVPVVPVTDTPVSTPTPKAEVTATTPKTATTLPQISANLGPDSTGAEVTALQSWLMSQGYSIPSLENGSAKPGFYGPETRAAVTQWQKDQEAKGALKIPDPSQYGFFGPLSRAAMTSAGAPVTPTTPTTTETPTGTEIPATGLGSEVDQTIAALRAAYGLTAADPKKTVVEQAIEDYEQVYKSLGLPSIKKSYTDAVKEFEKISNELNDKITNVRDDPWLSQGIADAKVRRLQDSYDGKLKIATAKMQLFDALVKEGIAQANDIISRVHQVQSDNATIVNQAIDIVQKKADALNDLDTEIVEVNGRKILIDSMTGNTIKDLGAVTKSSSGGSGGGTEAERRDAALSVYKTAFVPGATFKDGTPLMYQGYATAEGWKRAISEYSGSRADFIKAYGYLLYMEKNKEGKMVPAASYGLTPTEIKIVTGEL